jgi:hypothetical protein
MTLKKIISPQGTSGKEANIPQVLSSTAEKRKIDNMIILTGGLHGKLSESGHLH